jgi:CRISPR/Cas system CSM-associated protein Csm4 (group 5 of RAMP superfamily)
VTEFELDEMSETQVREFARRLIEALRLAQEDGIFGSDSWEGFLDIEV